VAAIMAAPMTDSKVERRRVKCSDVTWARSTHRRQLVFPVLLALSLMILSSLKKLESSSSCNDFVRLLRFVLELFLANTCLHTSAFRSFWSLSSFKMVLPPKNYLMCGWLFSPFDMIYDICKRSCLSPEKLKRRWTVSLTRVEN